MLSAEMLQHLAEAIYAARAAHIRDQMEGLEEGCELRERLRAKLRRPLAGLQLILVGDFLQVRGTCVVWCSDSVCGEASMMQRGFCGCAELEGSGGLLSFAASLCGQLVLHRPNANARPRAFWHLPPALNCSCPR